MLEIRVSSKLILFGEWAVLKSYSGVGVALSKSFRIRGQNISSPQLQIEAEGHQCALNHFDSSADSFFRFFLAGLQSQTSNIPTGWNLQITKDWRTEEGLGSSSASLLAGAIFAKGSLPPSPKDFWKELLAVLQSQQKGRGSGFDLAIQIFGQALHFENLEPQQNFHLNFPKELVLIHTGKKWDTTEKLSQTQASESFLKNMGKVAEDFLRNQDWPKAIWESHDLLKKEGIISPALIDDLDSVLKEGKVKAWKSTGAGGGDSILCWSDDVAALREACRKKFFWSTYPLVLGLAPEIGSHAI